MEDPVRAIQLIQPIETGPRPAPRLISFCNQGGEVGGLDCKDGQLTFGGNMAESACIFFEAVLKPLVEAYCEAVRPAPGPAVGRCGNKILYELHTSAAGHVMVECHCARCEVIREAEQEAERAESEKEQDVNGPESGYLIPVGDLFKDGMDDILARTILSRIPTEELAQYLLQRGAERARDEADGRDSQRS